MPKPTLQRKLNTEDLEKILEINAAALSDFDSITRTITQTFGVHSIQERRVLGIINKIQNFEDSIQGEE